MIFAQYMLAEVPALVCRGIIANKNAVPIYTMLGVHLNGQHYK